MLKYQCKFENAFIHLCKDFQLSWTRLIQSKNIFYDIINCPTSNDLWMPAFVNCLVFLTVLRWNTAGAEVIQQIANEKFDVLKTTNCNCFIFGFCSKWGIMQDGDTFITSVSAEVCSLAHVGFGQGLISGPDHVHMWSFIYLFTLLVLIFVTHNLTYSIIHH